MQALQNYQTIDSYKLDKWTTARVSQLYSELEDSSDPKSPLVPVDETNPHYVVAVYHHYAVEGHRTDSSLLRSCEHFIGSTAEEDAMAYYLSLVDPDEFPRKGMGSSWVPDRSFKIEVF